MSDAENNLRRHGREFAGEFHSFDFRHLRHDFLQQFGTFIGKGVDPTADLLLDVVLMPDLAQVEPDFRNSSISVVGNRAK